MSAETPITTASKRRPIVWIGWSALAVGSFHLAYLVNGWFMLGFLLAVFSLAQVGSYRTLFRIGMLVGILSYSPQLPFFWTIFGPAALALWSVLAAWLALYLVLQRAAVSRFGALGGTLLAPVLWTGLEYFRSELYYLRFSWLTPGIAMSANPEWVSMLGGVYGVGFCMMVVAVWLQLSLGKPWRRGLVYGITGCLAILLVSILLPAMLPAKSKGGPRPQKINFVGLSTFMEPDLEVLRQLDVALAAFPETDLFVMGEYAFDGPIPKRVRDWCAIHQRHIIAGGKDELADRTYFNTAFVISTNGEVVFKQAKSVPIQFFSDGRPAPSQEVWESPWGRIGFGVCYDLGFTRVMDSVVSKNPAALIIPTMDMDEWGGHQQRLHARIAPIRSAEYRVPVLRVCSEGISQFTQSGHQVANVPGLPKPVITGTIILRTWGSHPHLPIDRTIAPLCVAATGTFIAALAGMAIARRRRARQIVPENSRPNEVIS